MSSANAEQIRPLSRDAGEGWSGGATSAVSSNRPPTWTSGAIAAGAWLAAAAITHFLPDIDDFERTGLLANVMATLGLGLALLTFGCRLLGIRPPERISRTGPWLILLAASFAAWELVTAKFAVLPRPFFASPQALLEVFTDDYPKLGDSVWHSLTLLAGGYAIGAACGFIAGVAIGWSRTVGYWAHPVLRLVEPLAATAWLPLAFFAFPSSHSASTFLIALATGFPRLADLRRDVLGLLGLDAAWRPAPGQSPERSKIRASPRTPPEGTALWLPPRAVPLGPFTFGSIAKAPPLLGALGAKPPGGFQVGALRLCAPRKRLFLAAGSATLAVPVGGSGQ